MAEKIPGGVISPRIQDGVLYWRRGDVFKLNLLLKLYSAGEEYELTDSDTVTVTFYDSGEYKIHVFSAHADKNAVTMDFDKSISGIFDKGRYTYDIAVELSDGSVSTIADDNVAVVL